MIYDKGRNSLCKMYLCQKLMIHRNSSIRSVLWNLKVKCAKFIIGRGSTPYPAKGLTTLSRLPSWLGVGNNLPRSCSPPTGSTLAASRSSRGPRHRYASLPPEKTCTFVLGVVTWCELQPSYSQTYSCHCFELLRLLISSPCRSASGEGIVVRLCMCVRVSIHRAATAGTSH